MNDYATSRFVDLCHISVAVDMCYVMSNLSPNSCSDIYLSLAG